MTDPKPTQKDLEIARELLSGLSAINQHMGFVYTQPLFETTERIAQALARVEELIGKKK